MRGFSPLSAGNVRVEGLYFDQFCDLVARVRQPTTIRVGLSAQGYSKGMQQKVGLALAIAKQARALLLDEPTSGLDPRALAEFHDLSVRQRDAGAAVLMVTQDLFRAREVGTWIGPMREGELRRILTADGITASELETPYLEEMAVGSD